MFLAMGADDSEIATQLMRVKERVADAARSAGRSPESVRLIAVSKRHPAAAIRAAYAAGHRTFGENYPQELAAKSVSLSDLAEISFHMVGHVQKNKAKLVAAHADCVHTLGSAGQASALASRVEARSGEVMPVLIQVNIGREANKSGVSPDDLGALIDAVVVLPQLRLTGLMAIPPVASEPEGARRYFDALAEMRVQHGGEARLPELSMGMSADLEAAVQAGATMVRVGTSIFGERPVRSPTV